MRRSMSENDPESRVPVQPGGRRRAQSPRAPGRRERSERGFPRHLVLALCAAFFGACAEPEVSGRILLPFASGEFKPAGNVEILLVKGNLRVVLERMADRYEKELMEKVAASTLTALEERLASGAAELDSLRADLRSMRPDLEPEQCVAEAEETAARARTRRMALFQQLVPEMQALGVETTAPTVAVEQLSELLSKKIEEEAQRLSDEYLRTQIVVRSSALLSAGVREPDRLCWSLTNRGRLTLRSVDVAVHYKGKKIPNELVGKYWAIPARLQDIHLTIRDSEGREIRGLPSGATYSDCFHAARAFLSPEERRSAEALGLPAGAGSRGSGWEVVIERGVLTGAESVTVTRPGTGVPYVEYPARPLAEVLAPELRQVREHSVVGKLTRALTSSEEARNLEAAEQLLARCARAKTLGEQQREIKEAIEALEQGRATAPAARRAVAEFLEELKKTPEKHAHLVSTAEQKIESDLVTFQRSAADGTFSFAGVEKGTYTLVATSKTKQGGSLSWIVPVEVTGKVHKELGKAEAMEGTLRDVLAKILTRTTSRAAGDQPPTAAPVVSTHAPMRIPHRRKAVSPAPAPGSTLSETSPRHAREP